MSISHAHLRAFHAVASQGSFTRAADYLHVTQPTISGQVKELEERYGVKLLIRERRETRLTELGESIYKQLKTMFRLEMDVEQLLLSARELSTGELHVAADSPYIITPLLAQFQRLYPGVHISVDYGNSAEIMKWLESGKCDVAVLPNVPEDPRLEIIELQPDEIVLFVAADHPWASRQSVALDELESERLVMREKGSRTREIFEQALEQNQVKPSEIMEIRGREGVREAVAAGFGVGVITATELGSDSRFAGLQLEGLRLKSVELLVCMKQTRSARVTSAFMESVATGLTGS